MAASPTAMDTQEKWGPPDGQGGDTMGPDGSTDVANGAPNDAGQGSENPDFTRGSSVGGVSGGSKADASFREKQVKVLRVPSCLSRINGFWHAASTYFLCLSFSFFYRLARLVLTALARAFLSLSLLSL